MKHGRQDASGTWCGWCTASEQRAAIAEKALKDIVGQRELRYRIERDADGIPLAMTNDPFLDAVQTVRTMRRLAQEALERIGVAPRAPEAPLVGQDSLL